MADFLPAYNSTAHNERGYVKHRSDRGGETYNGVARNKHPGWVVWVYIDYCKTFPGFPNNIDHEGLKPFLRAFYRVEFWQKINGDNLADQDLAGLLYDIAVNMGPGSAGIYLQRILNLLNRKGKDYADIRVDGSIGNNTINALNRYLSRRGRYELMFWIYVQAGGKWMRLATEDPDQEDFMNGWGSRAIRNTKQITDKYYGVI